MQVLRFLNYGRSIVQNLLVRLSTRQWPRVLQFSTTRANDDDAMRIYNNVLANLASSKFSKYNFTFKILQKLIIVLRCFRFLTTSYCSKSLPQFFILSSIKIRNVICCRNGLKRNMSKSQSLINLFCKL